LSGASKKTVLVKVLDAALVELNLGENNLWKKLCFYYL
jgi:hypothetical protein